MYFKQIEVFLILKIDDSAIMQFYLSLDFAIEQYLLLNEYNLVITIVNHNNSHALQRNFIRNNSQTCLTCLHNLTLVYSDNKSKVIF